MKHDDDMLERLAPLSGAPSRGYDDLLRLQAKRQLARKIGAFAVVTVIVLALLGLGFGTIDDRTTRQPAGQTSTSVVSPTSQYELAIGDPLAPGRYAFAPDPYSPPWITMDIPSGWGGNDAGVIGKDTPNMAIRTWVVRNVYADPCAWQDTLQHLPAESPADALVAGLAAQKGRHASKPTEISLDGYSGTYMEVTVPAGIDLAGCDQGEFRSWEGMWTDPGRRDMLWIVDVDGTVLVLDAVVIPGTSAKGLAESTKIVESIQIDPV